MNDDNAYNHSDSDTDDCLFCVEHMEEAALGILECDDRERFEYHLTRCAICRAELAALDRTVQMLPLAIAQQSPSAGTKEKLQQRFLAAQAADAAPVMSPRSPQSRQTSPRSKPNRPLRSFSTLAAGLCVALAVIALWYVLPGDDESRRATNQNFQVFAMESSDSTSGGHIGADMDSTDGTMMAWNLDPAQTHEVWCVDHENNKLKVGELDVMESGAAMQTVSFPEEIGTYKQIYVARNDGTEELTITPNRAVNGDEPAPASATPTGR